MLDVALHTGTEHPDLLFAAVPTLLAFGIGLLLGARTGVVQQLFGSEQTDSAN